MSVGIGDGLDEAIDNGQTDQALYADYVGDALDGFMDFAELRNYLYGLLEFPNDLVVENEREPDWDLEALEKLLKPKRDDDSPT